MLQPDLRRDDKGGAESGRVLRAVRILPKLGGRGGGDIMGLWGL